MAEDKKKCCCSSQVRPSQLPIYDDPEDLFNISYEVSGKGQLQEGIEVARKELSSAVDATKEFRDQLSHIYETGKAHTAGELAHLRQEENVVARSGAIAVGGVLGLMLGVRGRFFKKLLYTSAGAAGTAALLYPQYSKQYTQEAFNTATSYTTVAYNFLVGVKPQTAKEEGDNTSPASSAASDSKAGGTVEVSNPYPSLLTLPHSRLFKRKEEKNYWPYIRSVKVKEVPVIISDNNLERIAEEASQVSTLGFRLQDREHDAIKGFGSVCEPTESEKSRSESSLEARNLPPTVKVKVEQHDCSNLPLTEKVEPIKPRGVSEISETLEGATKKIIEVAANIEKGAKLVEDVSEGIENVAEEFPVVGAEVESVAEFVNKTATVVEETAEEVKTVAESVEKVLNTVTSSVPSTLDQEKKDKKDSLFSKVANFFSSSDSTDVSSSELTISPSTGSESATKIKSASSLKDVEKKDDSSSNIPNPVTEELFATEPMQETDVAVTNESASSSQDSFSSQMEKATTDQTPGLDTGGVTSGESEETTVENAGGPALNEAEVISEKVKVQEVKEQVSLSVDIKKRADEGLNLTKETSEHVLESKESQKPSKQVSAEVKGDMNAEEVPSLFNKIANFFSSDSNSTKEPSVKSDVNNIAEGTKNQEPAIGSSVSSTEVETKSSKGASIVAKPQIPESLLKGKASDSPKQDSGDSSKSRTQLTANDPSKPQPSDAENSSAPSDATTESNSLVKTAPPNPTVIEISKSSTKVKERETVSRVRDEGGLMIIESPGTKDAFAAVEEASKVEPKEGPSENKAPAEDHGQGNPSDADMYTTRS